MKARDTLADLLRHGFHGTCAAAALETGLAKITVYVGMRDLEKEGLAAVIGSETTKGGRVDIWAAAPTHPCVASVDVPAGIVQRALASRTRLERYWQAPTHHHQGESSVELR